MIKAFNIIKALVSIALFAVLAYFTASALDSFFVYVSGLELNSELVFTHAEGFFPDVFEWFFGVIVSIVDVVAEMGTLIIFIIIMLAFCVAMNNRVLDASGVSINGKVFGKINYAAYKVRSFKKNTGFWVLCFFTGFMPLFIPLIISWAINILALVFKMALGPILLVVSYVMGAVRGSLA